MTPLWKLLERAGETKERVLRRLLPARMNVVPYSWPLLPEECPCDVHFCAWLNERQVRGRSLFHFGTGGHHLVGLRNQTDQLRNEVLGITASPGEHARYLKRLVRDPSFGAHYKVLFADVYDLCAAALPAFEVATLFHLCEFTPGPGQGRRLDDAGVLELLRSKLTPGGRLLFYRGSYGYPAARPLIEWAVAEGRLAPDEEYRTLLVYRVPPGAGTALRP